jgi:spermidine/putrescine transport system substrate-binding protein
MTRRHFLAITGGTAAVVAAGGLLAACSSTATPAPTAAPTTAATAAPTPVPSPACPSPVAVTGQVGGPFNLFCWEGYDGKGNEIWDAWWPANNIQLNVKYIAAENMNAFFKSPAGQEWDASSLNQGEVPNSWQVGILTPITDQDVPSLAKMYPFFRDGDLWKICEGTYAAVPWSFGPIAVIVRTDKVPADLLSSYEGLFDPKLAGRVGAFDDALNMISTAAIATGNHPGYLTREQLNGPVKDWLDRLRPQLKALQASIGDQSTVISSGDVWVELVGWAFFVPTLKAEGVQVEFVTPKEGAFGFVDSIFIPPTAPHRANAIAWTNAMMEGETAKAMNEWTVQLSSNPEVNQTLSQDVLSIFPSDIEGYLDQLKFNRSYYDPNGPYATMEEWTKVWTEAKAGI